METVAEATASIRQLNLTHEARRYCRGDGEWSNWQPCTAEQAERRKSDDTFQVRQRTKPST